MYTNMLTGYDTINFFCCMFCKLSECRQPKSSYLRGTEKPQRKVLQQAGYDR